MAATLARSGFGTLLQRGDGATPTEGFTTIPEVGDINGPAKSLLMVDATHMESPNGYEEKIPAIKQGGDVTFPVQFIPGNATQAGLEADLEAQTKRNFRLILAGNTHRWSFSAYVQNIGPSYPMKDKMVQDVTLSITGKPVYEVVS